MLQDYQILRQELELYRPDLMKRPLIVANKMDVPEAQANYERLRAKFGHLVYAISAVTGLGLISWWKRPFGSCSLCPKILLSVEKSGNATF